MKPRASHVVTVTPQDLSLLATLSECPNLVRACDRLGLSRDQGLYALRRMSRIAGGPIVATRRGGDGGSTRLTPLGRRLMGAGVGAADPSSHQSTVLEGTWRGRPEPHITLTGGPDLVVGFSSEEGAVVTVAIDPEAIIVARKRYPTSARNTLPATVDTVHAGPESWYVEARVGQHPIRVALTAESVKSLRLRAGARIWLYLKATAVRRLGGPNRRSGGRSGPRGSGRP